MMRCTLSAANMARHEELHHPTREKVQIRTISGDLAWPSGIQSAPSCSGRVMVSTLLDMPRWYTGQTLGSGKPCAPPNAFMVGDVVYHMGGIGPDFMIGSGQDVVALWDYDMTLRAEHDPAPQPMPNVDNLSTPPTPPPGSTCYGMAWR
jgi:hypothetical protein